MQFRNLGDPNSDLGVPLTQKMTKTGAGMVEYIGRANPGAATSAAVWQIQKLTYDSENFTTDIQFANGTIYFDKIWDNRAGYTYS